MTADKKDAVTIGVTLSTQIITASLAMIAVVGTFVAFTIDKKLVGPFYYVIIILSFLLFVVSILLGGKGIDKARKDGFNGNWNLVSTKQYFNFQSICALTGILLFTVSVFIGKEKELDIQKDVNFLNSYILKRKLDDSLKNLKLETMSLTLDSIKRALSTIKKQNLKKYKRQNHLKHC